MRIWDVHPGYLARQQLLGEHRELHGLFNILMQGKKGYANHPETLRWVGCSDALILRHRQLSSEMALRGYNHRSPLPPMNAAATWPETYIDSPVGQLALLAGKYAGDGRSGRIVLPKNCQQLWAQHKYSVMAHDPNCYREIGPEVAHGCYRQDMEGLGIRLVTILRKPPAAGHLYNALQHMWGYVIGGSAPPEEPYELLVAIQHASISENQRYLQQSTALSELAVWL